MARLPEYVPTVGEQVKASILEALGRLSASELVQVAKAVEQARLLGSGWLVRSEEGKVQALATADVLVTSQVVDTVQCNVCTRPERHSHTVVNGLLLLVPD